MNCHVDLLRNASIGRIALAGIIVIAVHTKGAAAASALEWRTVANVRGDARQHAPVRERAAALASARRAIARALALISRGKQPEIVLIDPELAGDPAAVERLDAFTVRETDGELRQKIYVNLESPIVTLASRGDELYVSILAAVIVHELAHLKGADEPSARREERRFFEHQLAQARIDPVEGLRYLAILRRRAEHE